MTVAPELMPSVRLALDCHRRGQLAEAERLCREALRVEPRQPEALHLLALIALQAKQHAAGIELLRASLALNPHQPFAHSNLGAALFQLNRPSEALESCEQALRLAPELPIALTNRGNALRALGRRDEAILSFERALALAPRDPITLNDYGNCCVDLGRHSAALEAFDRALQERPGDTMSLNNKGAALLGLKRHREALDCFERALTRSPDDLNALQNRGTALLALERAAEALPCFERAVASAPGHALVRNGLASALLALERYDEACAVAEEAVRLDAMLADAWTNLGNARLKQQNYPSALQALDRAIEIARSRSDTRSVGVLVVNSTAAEMYFLRGFVLQRLNRASEAVDSYRAAVELEARAAKIWSNLAGALFETRQFEDAAHAFARVLALEPSYPFIAGNLSYARRLLAAWGDDMPDTSTLVTAVLGGERAALPLTLLPISADPVVQLRCARTYVASEAPATTVALAPTRPYGHERLRIGYLSGDLREHAVAYLIAGLIEQHDRSRFEIIALSLQPAGSGPYGSRISRGVSEFVDLSRLNDRAAAERIRALEIDILIDLTGYTQGFRSTLLSRRPAPIQVNYLGYPGTLGASYIDYIVADEYLIPEAQRAHYAEQVLTLPDCFQANDDRRVRPEPSARAELGLPEQAIVLCCFNNSYKLNPTFFEVWMRLLAARSDALLWLVAGLPVTELNLRREAAARGIDPARLHFAQRLPYGQHLARLAAADLFLDTLPFNGGTTASDALWMGVPVLTCSGAAFAARMAGSLLTALGLPELITCDLAHYEQRALELLEQPHQLAALRGRLLTARTSSPLFDTARFARHFEAALIAMQERFERGLPPAPLAVPRLC